VTRVLVVEDEPDLALTLADDLAAEGFEAEVVRDGETASLRGRESGWDVILLDVMLPRRDGLDVCRDLRRAGVRTPIIILTARSQEAEKILGLDLGADDYVTKPFSLRELRSRIRAVLRRTQPDSAEVYRSGNLEIDFSRGELRRGGRAIELTPIEYRLLCAFVRAKGRLLSREQLVEAGWGPGISVNDRAVDSHIVSLRRKIEPQPSQPRIIVSARGLGYRFEG
jgi:DNA-binding response OmpR family regulator